MQNTLLFLASPSKIEIDIDRTKKKSKINDAFGLLKNWTLDMI